MSIKWKVFTYLSLFTGIILVILWLIQTVFLADIYKTIKMRDITKSANEIVKVLNTSKLEETAKSLARKNELCILVTDKNGKTLVSAENLPNCVIHSISYRDHSKLYLDAKANNGVLSRRFKYDPQTNRFFSVNDKETLTEESIIFTKCVTDKNENDTIIFINSTLTPVASTVRTLNIMLIYISGILLIIALILSFIISHNISKPIKKLTKSANELAHGNYDTDFTGNGFAEINALAETLSYASSELKKNEILKRELIANISHDLRTPLTLITGYSEAMRDLPNEMTPENLQIIIDESNRMSSLVNDVLDISKLQAKTIELNFESFDITEVIQETAKRYQRLVDRDGYRIEFIPNEQGYVNADRQKILQVVYNLVNNAVTHTGTDKLVIIRQSFVERNDGEYVRIEVTDTGNGIEAESLPLIWDRYYKVDKYHKRASLGSGLGLSIVKQIIELHQGYYGVFSTIGKGSTFWFEIKKFK